MSLSIGYGCVSEQTKIYCSIADNLTQLKTLKIFAVEPDETIATLNFKTVESFYIYNVNPGYVFEFDDLKELTLQSKIAQPSYLMNLAQRNRKLKKLTLIRPHRTFFDDGVIRNILNELPELEQILVNGLEDYEYPIFKHLLGGEWEQFEMEGTVKLERHSLNVYKRFRRISSKD